LVDERAQSVLKDISVGYLAAKLDDEEQRWDQTLSGGERQCIAFARLLIDQPNIIVVDEATAALNIDSEFRLLTLPFERLPRLRLSVSGTVRACKNCTAGC
jgi:putative ATP-binding cassette transporter